MSSSTSLLASFMRLPAPAQAKPEEPEPPVTTKTVPPKADKLAKASSEAKEIFDILQQVTHKDPSVTVHMAAEFQKIFTNLNSAHTLDITGWQNLLDKNPTVAKNSMQNLHDGLAKMLLLCHENNLITPNLVCKVDHICQQLEKFGAKPDKLLKSRLTQIRSDASAIIAQFNNPAAQKAKGLYTQPETEINPLQLPKIKVHKSKTEAVTTYEPQLKELPPFDGARINEIDEFAGKLPLLYLEHPHTAVKTARCFIGELHTRLAGAEPSQFSNEDIKKIESITKKLCMITAEAKLIFKDVRDYKYTTMTKVIMETPIDRDYVNLGNMFGLDIFMEDTTRSFFGKIIERYKHGEVMSDEMRYSKERQETLEWALKGIDRQYTDAILKVTFNDSTPEDQLTPYQAALQQEPKLIRDVTDAIKEAVHASDLPPDVKERYEKEIKRFDYSLRTTDMEDLGRKLLRSQQFDGNPDQEPSGLIGFTLNNIALNLKSVIDIAKKCRLVLPPELAEKALQACDILAATNIKMPPDLISQLELYLIPQESIIKDYHAIPGCVKVIEYIGSMQQSLSSFLTRGYKIDDVPRVTDEEGNDIIDGFSAERLDNITDFCRHLGQQVLNDSDEAFTNCQAFAGELYLMVKKSAPGDIPLEDVAKIQKAVQQLSLVYGGATKIDAHIKMYEEKTSTALCKNLVSSLNRYIPGTELTLDNLPQVVTILEKAEYVFNYPHLSMEEKADILYAIQGISRQFYLTVIGTKTAAINQAQIDNMQKFMQLVGPFLQFEGGQRSLEILQEASAMVEQLTSLQIITQNMKAANALPPVVADLNITPEFLQKLDLKLPVASAWEKFCLAWENLINNICGRKTKIIKQEEVQQSVYKFCRHYKKEIAFLGSYGYGKAEIRQFIENTIKSANPDLNTDEINAYADIVARQFETAQKLYRQDLFADQPFLKPDNLLEQMLDMPAEQFITFFLNNEPPEIQEAIRQLPPHKIFDLKDHYIHLLLKEIPDYVSPLMVSSYYQPITADSQATANDTFITQTGIEAIHADLVALAKATIAKNSAGAPQAPDKIESKEEGAQFIISELYSGIPDIQHFYSGLLKVVYARTTHHSFELPGSDDEFANALKGLSDDVMIAILQNCCTMRLGDILRSTFSEDTCINDPESPAFSLTQWRLCGMEKQISLIRYLIKTEAERRGFDFHAFDQTVTQSPHVACEYARFFDSEEEISSQIISGEQPLPFPNHGRYIDWLRDPANFHG